MTQYKFVAIQKGPKMAQFKVRIEATGPLTPHEANLAILEVVKKHIQELQAGTYGEPTLEDLMFCGRIVKLIEEA